MSLAEQIRELENELEHYQIEASQLSNELANTDGRIADLEHEVFEQGKFIEYVDATHPELRTAYEAAKILKGDTP
jgi:predicted  nucleic acid-binding Zn-ribbon protein